VGGNVIEQEQERRDRKDTFKKSIRRETQGKVQIKRVH